LVPVGAWRVRTTPSPYDLKILHFIPVYAPAWKFGGPVRSVSALAEEQARQGHKVTVLTTNAGMTAADGIIPDKWILRNGVDVCYCRQEDGFGIKSTSLEKRVKDRAGEFDIMHLSAIWHPVARAAHNAARLGRVPVIVSPRGGLGPYAWQRRRWLKKIYYDLFERAHLKAAAGFHFTSSSEALESAQFIFRQPACVVPNGIDESLWRRNELAAIDWRAAQGFAKSDLLLLYVGRLHHKKGLEILPATLVKVQLAFPGQRLRLVLVGPNENGTLQQLEKEMVRAVSPGCLQWIPTLPAVALATVYSAADIFLMPSFHENFGNSAIEALACGCVSLVSAETGCFEFGDGCGMKSVATHDSDQWADAITEIFKSGRNVVTGNERTKLFSRVGLRATATEIVRFYQTIQTKPKNI